MAAAVSLHLDTLVWNLHVRQLPKDKERFKMNKDCHVYILMSESFMSVLKSVQTELFTSVLRPMKGMLVSHIATR